MRGVLPHSVYRPPVSVQSFAKNRSDSIRFVTGQCFEMPNVSYTQPLCTSVKRQRHSGQFAT